MNPTTQRIAKAIETVEDHLHDDLQATTASGSACYSHYHFLRLFLALTGMTVGAYVRRRRLTKAAEALLRDKTRIIEIALEAGFESQAAFSRAFRDMFDETPARFRREEKRSSARGQPALTEAYLHHLQTGAVTMKPRFEHREAFTVVGIGKDSPAGKGMEVLWNEFLLRKHQIEQTQGTEAYGVCYAPQEKENFPEKFHYTAALRVRDDAPVPTGMEKIRIEAHDYAVFTHKGPIADLPKTNDYIWKTWVPQSGLELADAPDFERYDARFKPDSAASEFEIYVPVIR